MADSKTGTGKVQGKTRTSHNIKKQENAKKLMETWQKDIGTSLRVKCETI